MFPSEHKRAKTIYGKS